MTQQKKRALRAIVEECRHVDIVALELSPDGHSRTNQEEWQRLVDSEDYEEGWIDCYAKFAALIEMLLDDPQRAVQVLLRKRRN